MQKNVSCSQLPQPKFTGEEEGKENRSAGEYLPYVPSSLLWLTEPVSGAGSSTRGGSQCGLSLMRTGGGETKS